MRGHCDGVGEAIGLVRPVARNIEDESDPLGRVAALRRVSRLRNLRLSCPHLDAEGFYVGHLGETDGPPDYPPLGFWGAQHLRSPRVDKRVYQRRVQAAEPLKEDSKRRIIVSVTPWRGRSPAAAALHDERNASAIRDYRVPRVKDVASSVEGLHAIDDRMFQAATTIVRPSVRCRSQEPGYQPVPARRVNVTRRNHHATREPPFGVCPAASTA